MIDAQKGEKNRTPRNCIAGGSVIQGARTAALSPEIKEGSTHHHNLTVEIYFFFFLAFFLAAFFLAAIDTSL